MHARKLVKDLERSYFNYGFAQYYSSEDTANNRLIFTELYCVVRELTKYPKFE